MLALTDGGRVMAWGASKTGCLGLGADRTIVVSPTMLEFPNVGSSSSAYNDGSATPRDINVNDGTTSSAEVCIVELAKGDSHVLARTDSGHVFAWGSNTSGQLGIGNPSGSDIHCEPLPLQFPFPPGVRIVQVVCKQNSSFAVSSQGEVYAWGSNVDFSLGLEGITASFVAAPRRNETLSKCLDDDGNMQTVYVTRLQVVNEGSPAKGAGGSTSLVLAMVDRDRDKLVELYGVMAAGAGESTLDGASSFGHRAHSNTTYANAARNRRAMQRATAEEHDLYEGLMTLRETIRKARETFDQLSEQQELCWIQVFGKKISLLWSQSDELYADKIPDDELLIGDIDLTEYRNALQKYALNLMEEQQGSKRIGNVDFLLRNVNMKLERCLRVERSRAILQAKRNVGRVSKEITAFRADAFEEIRKLQQHNSNLEDLLTSVEQMKASDILTREVQVCIIETKCQQKWARPHPSSKTLLAKRQTNLTKIELVKRLQNLEPGSHVKPAIQVLEERWKMINAFSLFNLISKDQDGKAILSNRKWSGDQAFQKLVELADTCLDRIADEFDRDAILSRDLLLPNFAYTLLLDNVKLRKMCNQYQLRVLLIHRGKSLLGDPEQHLPEGEAVFFGSGAPLEGGKLKREAEAEVAFSGGCSGETV
eukprot:g10056.t1